MWAPRVTYLLMRCVVNTVKAGMIVGSNRRESINRLLATAITKLDTRDLEFTWINILDLPIYNQDLEGQRPEPVNQFTAAVNSVDALFFVTPEYNRSLPTVLKNAIDWGSKPMDKNVWKGKPVAMTGITPGKFGTAFAQMHMRQVLGALGSIVIGGEAYLNMTPGLIDQSGAIADESTRQFLQAYLDQFAAFSTKLAAR